MNSFDPQVLHTLFRPPSSSHKGENGKVLIIAGSKLFHAAALWPLSIASKIVDMVFFASVPENNELVLKAKDEFRNGIVIRRNDIDAYIDEADSILIGPGLPRESGKQEGDNDTKKLSEELFIKYPQKKWVIDGGSLQMVDPQLFPQNSIITPHHQEFELLQAKDNQSETENPVQQFAKQHRVIVLLKGEHDIIASNDQQVEISGGNAGMTKGGTGDVLAGLTAALYAQNDDPFLVACVASYINKKAGERLFQRVGYYFNASDLLNEIPYVMKEVLLSI